VSRTGYPVTYYGSYRLAGYVEHFGSTVEKGHYRAQVNDFWNPGTWKTFDDGSVSRVRFRN
jgi:ubiquitin C-terminal hydrolase